MERATGAAGMVHVVEQLSSKLKALNSISNTAKKKKKKSTVPTVLQMGNGRHT
jgi:hypothetical protein